MARTATATSSSSHVFELTGGALCLDFVNTVSDRPSERPIEHLTTGGDLIEWARQAGVLNDRQARAAQRKANAEPRATERLLREATGLRETLFKVLTAIVSGQAPTRDALDALDRHLRPLLARSRLRYEAGRFSWTPVGEPCLECVLEAVARSATDLLTSDRIRDLRECAAHDCRWLFLDATKNHRRRWCDMKACGNREKARRFRERHG